MSYSALLVHWKIVGILVSDCTSTYNKSHIFRNWKHMKWCIKFLRFPYKIFETLKWSEVTHENLRGRFKVSAAGCMNIIGWLRDWFVSRVKKDADWFFFTDASEMIFYTSPKASAGEVEECVRMRSIMKSWEGELVRNRACWKLQSYIREKKRKVWVWVTSTE